VRAGLGKGTTSYLMMNSLQKEVCSLFLIQINLSFDDEFPAEKGVCSLFLIRINVSGVGFV
jgi:hypothetical protein